MSRLDIRKLARHGFVYAAATGRRPRSHQAVVFFSLCRFVSREAGTPSKPDRAALLAPLVTAAALLDVCALFGAGAAAERVGEIAAALLSLRPPLADDLAAVGEAVATNLAQVVDACLAAARSASRDAAMLQSLLDGLAYLRDSCLTLCALLRAAPSAAPALLRRGPSLVEALGAVHDQLLPKAEATAAAGGGGVPAVRDELHRRCRHVEVACERAVELLLVQGFLEASAGQGGGSGGEAGSSRSGGGSAVARGEALLGAVMLLGHREGEAAGSGGASLAPALAQRHFLAARIQAAQSSGAVALDDAQADYLAALMDVPSLGEAPAPVPAAAQSQSHAAGGEGSWGGQASAAADDSAAELSRVAAVLELLPDLGEGYVAACLAELGGSVEAAVNALLEGAPPPEVKHLDPTLSYQQYQRQRAPAAAPAPAPSGSSRAGPGARGPLQQQQQRPDSLTARYLDTKGERYRGTVLAAAAESQWEYEDEYDDSFDELMHLGADGLAEAEGEEEGADPGAGPSSLEGPMQSMSLQHGGRGGGRQGKGARVWVLDGRIYNYAKAGAEQVGSAAEAEAKVQEAQQAAQQIHGLGPGGNVPLYTQTHADNGGGAGGGRGGGGRGGDGGGRGRGQGRGGGGSSHGWKDKNKAAIGNHHRKDRAAQKQSRGMG